MHHYKPILQQLKYTIPIYYSFDWITLIIKGLGGPTRKFKREYIKLFYGKPYFRNINNYGYQTIAVPNVLSCDKPQWCISS